MVIVVKFVGNGLRVKEMVIQENVQLAKIQDRSKTK